MRIDWNPDGLYEVRADPALVEYEERVAQEIADRANEIGKGTYAVGSRQGVRSPQGRWRTSVVTADARAMANNAKNNTLIKAMDG